MPPRIAPLRRVFAAFLSAAVALAALSAEPEAFAQKPAPGAKKKGGPKGAARPRPKGAGAAGAAAPAAPAAPAKKADPPTPVTPVALSLPLTRFTLDNGLRVVLNVDTTSPTVAIAVVYDVGARNEEKGRTGFAHLFEHMMFQGSKNVKRGEHFKLVTSHGGVLDGTTSFDRTNYYEMLPSSELALGLWLEADRMASLDVTQESFESQRKVVKEEYRMRVSNAPYVPGALRLNELVFQGYWPYEHPAIGTMADLDAAQLDWVKDFHAKHYGPNNAVLAIAGDFDPAEATALVHKYFDKIPRIQTAPFVDAKVPEQTSQRTAVLRDEHALSPAVLYGWQAPPRRETGAYALDLAAILLGAGESSRLHQLLVRDKAVAQGVSAYVDLRRGPSLFQIDAKLVPGVKTAEVQKHIDATVKALGDRGPTADELAKAQRRAQARLIFGLQTNGARARVLAEYELYYGDAGLLAAEPARYLAVTADDLKKAVATHLSVNRRTVVETYPLEPRRDDRDAKKAAPAGGEPASPPAATAKATGAPPAAAPGKKGDAAPKKGADAGAKKKADAGAKKKTGAAKAKKGK